MSELVPGKPSPYAIYNESGKLILGKGAIPESVVQLAQWADQPLFRIAEESSQKNGETRDPPKAAAKDEGQTLSLDHIKLSIGDMFQVQMQSEQTEQKSYVKLIGYLRGKSVIVTLPEINGNPCLIRDG